MAFLPPLWAALVLAATPLAWLKFRLPYREKVISLLVLIVMVAALLLEWTGQRAATTSPEDWAEDAAEEYADLWAGLRSEAQEAAQALDHPPERPDERLQAFRKLARLVAGRGEREVGRRALLLLDPDGAAVAWSGEGLLHEPTPEEVPRAGPAFQASFTAITLLSVEPLPSDRQARRPWRVVAGASFPADRLPFSGPSNRLRWSLVGRPEEALPGMLLVPSQAPPYLVVEPSFKEMPPAFPWARRMVWGAIAFGLLALAVMRSPVLALAGEPESASTARSESPVRQSILAAVGVVAAGIAAGLSWTVLAVLAAGLALAGWGVSRWEVPGWWRSGARAIAVRGAASAVLLFLGAWALQITGEPIDLGSAVLATPAVFSLRLAFAAAAFGLFYLAGRREGPAALPLDRWVWAGAGLLLLGAVLCDFPFVALPVLAAGTAALSVYADRRQIGGGLAVAAVALMAILASSALWETAYRLALRRWAETVLLNKVTPPTREQMDSVGREVDAHLSSRDLAKLLPRRPAGLERQDLAYALWRDSPLARPYSLSALVVLPREGPPSSFSFGMPLTQDNRVDWSPDRWRELGLPLWEESPIYDEAPLRLAGRPWGAVRFWLMPRPGFELRDRRRVGEVEAGLLKGGPAADPVQALLEPAVYALYTEDGRPSLAPWDETPRLTDQLRPPSGRGSTIVDTPVGRARAYSHMTLGVWEVIYLPFLKPFEALERTANSSVGLLLLVALAVPPVLLLSLPRASFRAVLRRVVRSYSKRLIIVYTILLLVPLLLLNVVLIRSM